VCRAAPRTEAQDEDDEGEEEQADEEPVPSHPPRNSSGGGWPARGRPAMRAAGGESGRKGVL
jgi:hypothetical protein